MVILKGHCGSGRSWCDAKVAMIAIKTSINKTRDRISSHKLCMSLKGETDADFLGAGLKARCAGLTGVRRDV
jgi:hypothetical protein